MVHWISWIQYISHYELVVQKVNSKLKVIFFSFSSALKTNTLKKKISVPKTRRLITRFLVYGHILNIIILYVKWIVTSVGLKLYQTFQVYDYFLKSNLHCWLFRLNLYCWRYIIIKWHNFTSFCKDFIYLVNEVNYHE